MENATYSKKNQLLINGFYIGELGEIVPNLVEFNQNIDKVKECFHNDRGRHFLYRNVVQQHPEYTMFVELDVLEERRKLIKDNNYSIGQQWYESTNNTDEIQICRRYFENIVGDLACKCYPELDPHRKNYRFNDHFSVFTDGDFIEPHVDGQNTGRLCVVLIYLTEHTDYNDGGGELILNDKDVEVKPVKGRYVILDFTKHNLRHEVKLVRNNFLRYTYISFVYNTDKE